MSASPRPKAHHKVPRFYLEGFRDSESGTGKKARIWVYRRGESNPRRSNPRATAFETDFYSIIGEDGSRDASLEEVLADFVDAPASAVWNRLEDREARLSIEERGHVARFIAFMFTRTSSIRNDLEKVFDDLDHMIDRMRKVAEEKKGDPNWNPSFGSSKSNGYVIRSQSDLDALRPSHNSLVGVVGAAHQEISEYLMSMNWTVLHSIDDAEFITSDNPVVRRNPFIRDPFRSADIGINGIEISIPISRKCMLVCSYHGIDGHMDVYTETTLSANRKTLDWSVSEVYSSRREPWLDQEFFGRVD